MSRNVFNLVTDKILQSLRKGVVPWKRPWGDNGPPRNLISKRPYNGINVFMLAWEGYASPYWLTRKQAERIGGNIPAEARPAQVVFWMFWTARANVEGRDEDGATGRLIYRIHDVYNSEQVLGIEHRLPEHEAHDFSPLETCERIVAGAHNPPLISHGVPAAYYSPLLDIVNMPSRKLFQDPHEYYCTLFHELVHSTGHKKRLGRHLKQKESFESHKERYSQEELVAEIGAGFLCAHAGIDNLTIQNSASYIQAWHARLENEPKLFWSAAGQAQAGVNYLLGRLPSGRQASDPEHGCPDPYCFGGPNENE